MTTPTTPHDSFFKAVFQDPRHAAALLRALLPTELVDRIDWVTLTTIHTNLIGDDLAQRDADLLFEVQLAGQRPVLLLVLLEHQSTVDRFMAFRVLQYMVMAWTEWRRLHPSDQHLPPLFPVVLYQGATRWTAPTRFPELLDLDPELLSALGRWMPDFHFLLHSLRDVDDDALVGTTTGRENLWLLKHAWDGGLWKAWLARGAMPQVVRESGLEMLRPFVGYVLEVGKDASEENLARLTAQLKPEERDVVSTMSQLLQEKGRNDGIAEGEARGEARARRSMLREALEMKFGPLSAQVDRRLADASVDDLLVWFRRQFSSDDIEQVFAND